MVTVYTKPGCVQCGATYRALDKKGIEFSVIDVTENPEAFEKLKAMGVQQMPAVETDNDFWTGFNPGKIKELPGA